MQKLLDGGWFLHCYMQYIVAGRTVTNRPVCNFLLILAEGYKSHRYCGIKHKEQALRERQPMLRSSASTARTLASFTTDATG